ncbi:unnamed protein product [Microthlaspi erraticum]|uniref:HD domain-containing protein n=1 Tax=Microthlaspi erraticum TaxID=1685480 RepID=A0A6D2IJ49_9BRAS|nr:unnamed protein product [Microthlaspi erraticum]
MGANCDDDLSSPVSSVAGAPTNELRLSKHVYDNVHGNIYLDPLCLKFIDTEQFQRLRELKQLGVTRMVYPGAVHSRFEHSLGVYWLAGETVQRLQTFQGMELDIDRYDLQTVRLSGLLHDIGHGPFSHMFEREFLPRVISDCKWSHESMSVTMIDNIVDTHHIDIDPQMLKRVKDMILASSKGFELNNNEEKRFLYDIVANGRNGIDVDKFDYIVRDSRACGLGCNFQFQRLTETMRVMDNEICYRAKEYRNVHKLFSTRADLHRTVYTHPKVKAIELMIADAMVKANDHLGISSYIDNPSEYWKLDETILKTIENSSRPELAEARELILRVRRRQLYQFCNEYAVPKDKMDHFKSVTAQDIICSQGLELDIDRHDLQTVRRTGILQGTKMKETAEAYHGRKFKDAKKKQYTSEVGQPSKRGKEIAGQPSIKGKEIAYQDSEDEDSDTEEDSDDDADPDGIMMDLNEFDYQDLDEDDDYMEYTDTEEDEDSDSDADPNGIMMESPDLRLRLQNLGEYLNVFGEHVEQQVREGKRVYISSQVISNETARILLEERFNGVESATNPETQLMLCSYGDEARIYWESNAEEYRQYSSRKTSRVAKRITKTAGHIRNQKCCRLCWCFALTDLISAILWLDGWEQSYKSLSPMYLCRKVAPDKREQHISNGIIHYCYGHNVDDALKHIMAHGVPNVEWEETDDCYAKTGFEDDYEDRYYVRRVFEYQTLADALERLRTHPVTASLACYKGWEEKKVYRGPLNQDAELEGSHQVLMLHCRVIKGELVVKCKLSNGKDTGFMGYIFVSLHVMHISVGSLRREGIDTDICHIQPQHLLSDFYSVEMGRTKASKEEAPSGCCSKRKTASHVLKSKAFFKDQSQIYNKAASGAAVQCQMLDITFPGAVPMHKVNFDAKNEYEMIQNYEVMQEVFTKLKITKPLEVNRLVKGRPLDKLEFRQWLKRFCDSINGGIMNENYNPVEGRSRGGKEKSVKGASKASKSLQTNNMHHHHPPVTSGLKQAKSHAVGGGSNSSAQVQALSKELAELKVSVDLESDFYFSKLRDIEILCQTPELDELAIVVTVMKMLYATDANESPLEEAQECLGQSLGLEAAEEEEGKEEVEEEAEAETKT